MSDTMIQCSLCGVRYSLVTGANAGHECHPHQLMMHAIAGHMRAEAASLRADSRRLSAIPAIAVVLESLADRIDPAAHQGTVHYEVHE